MSNNKLWRTHFEPLPDITTYELALDMKCVNASQIVSSWQASKMGSALRHRVLDEWPTTGLRMDQVFDKWKTDNLVDRAIDFARRVHRDQKRKYTNEPYFVHLKEVALLCAEHGADDITVAAAYLHDAIEDQPVTYADLVDEFGKQVADIVLDLTDTETVQGGPNRAARKAIDRARLAGASSAAQTIKCADLISNTSTIVEYDKNFARVYLREKRATLEVLDRAELRLRERAWRVLVEAEGRLGISGDGRPGRAERQRPAGGGN
jgi:hypothetical protein